MKATLDDATRISVAIYKPKFKKIQNIHPALPQNAEMCQRSNFKRMIAPIVRSGNNRALF